MHEACGRARSPAETHVSKAAAAPMQKWRSRPPCCGRSSGSRVSGSGSCIRWIISLHIHGGQLSQLGRSDLPVRSHQQSWLRHATLCLAL